MACLVASAFRADYEDVSSNSLAPSSLEVLHPKLQRCPRRAARAVARDLLLSHSAVRASRARRLLLQPTACAGV
eukprot:4444505-Pyramimonas_sp.AAC.1